MTDHTRDIFRQPSTAPRTALFADTGSSADQTLRVLHACGLTVTPIHGGGEGTLARTRHAEVAIIDADCGGLRQGYRLLESVHRRTDASIIVMADRLELPPPGVSSERCQLLLRPVHEHQIRATVELAVARRRSLAALRGGTPPAAAARHDRVERVILEITGLLRSLETSAVPDVGPQLDQLRPRERQIVGMLLEHKRVPAIARVLQISTHTVRNHLKNIYRRLGVHSQQDLLAMLTANAAAGSAKAHETAIDAKTDTPISAA